MAKKIIVRSPPSALACTLVCYFFSLIFLSTMLSYIPSYLLPKSVAMMIPPWALANANKLSHGNKYKLMSLECRASCDETCVSQSMGITRWSETEVARISRHPDRTWQFSTLHILTLCSRNRSIWDTLYCPLMFQTLSLLADRSLL